MVGVVAGVLLSVLAVASIAVPLSNSPQARLHSSVTTYDQWTGYDGNDTIYPTKDTHPQVLPILTPAEVWVNSAGGNDSYAGGGVGFTDENGLVLAINDSPGNVPFCENLGPPDYGFECQIWFSAAGAAQTCICGTLDLSNTYGPYAIYLGATGPTLPAGASIQTLPGDNAGINLTQVPGIAATLEAIDAMAASLGAMAALGPIELGLLGLALSGPAVGLDLGGAFGLFSGSPYPTCASSFPPGNSLCQYALVDNGTYGPAYTGTDGRNYFEQGTAIQVSIPESDLAEVPNGQISFNAYDQLQLVHEVCEGKAGCVTTTSTFAGLSTSSANDPTYSIAPAVGIGGYVQLYPGGPGAPGATVTLAQTGCSQTADFVETTNSAGYWHFFADPGCSYSYSVSYSGSWYGNPVSMSRSGSWSSSLTGTGNTGQDTETLNTSLWGGAVSFQESGLPSSQLGYFSVTLNGVTESSGGGTVVSFLIANGSYSFSVGAITDYASSPSSGTVAVSGAAVTEDITFTETGSYTVTISEKGLASGDTWSAGVGTTSKSGAAGATLTFSGLTGTNAWSASAVVVSESCSGDVCTVKEYLPSPASGSVGGPSSISVTYTLTTVTIRT